MQLPHSNSLPTNKLSSVFNSTSATYKFYWLIALVELVEEENIVISKRKLFARMISNSWYTINYFHISFGKQDNLQIAVERILKEENLTIDENKKNLIFCLENSKNKQTLNQLFHFDKNVPHWFLSSWFPKQNINSIYNSSKKFEDNCIYALHKEHIEMNPEWVKYLKSNAKVLKDFCYWNLALFLQNRNPNVPDIPNKLIKPATRNSLTKQTNEYWKLVFQELGHINCIFTDTKLYYDKKNYALDHFIPHAFVSHDLIWNLTPIEKAFNAFKSDKLPIFEDYFDKFYELQKTAFEINKQQNSNSKYLDEFLTIFPNINEFEKDRLSNTIQPLLTIANNNGFLFMEKNQ